MDRRERIYDPEEMMRMALDAKQTQIWTAMPAIIQSFNPVAMTCEVKPTITGLLRTPEGNYQQVEMPLLLDCPVFFPGGGGVTLTFPIKPGDECLVVFASRCIDAWWQLGGIQGQAEYRMHDISDGFIFAGVRSQPRAFNVDTNAAQLRSDDGAAFVEINPTSHNIKAQTSANINAQSGGNITANASGEIIATAPTIKLVGNVEITGNLNISGTTVGNGINLNTHVHDGVQTGGGNTGAPVA
jgi:phage baseplate assembly protein gpV